MVASLIAFLSTHATSLSVMRIGVSFSRFMLPLLRLLGPRIRCLTVLGDMRRRQLELLPLLVHLETSGRVLYRESESVFDVCPSVRRIVCRRLNYESLYAIPGMEASEEAVVIADREQEQRYASFTTT